MPVPKCSIHNIDMVLKTARKGRNAGGKFWGCPTWPTTKCKETRPFEGENRTNSPRVTLSNASVQIELPRLFQARPRFQGFNVRFLESAAFPEKMLEHIIESEPSESTLQAISQWRIDYPPARNIPNWTERERQAFSVAEKILLRGHITLTSPLIEQYSRANILEDDEQNELNEKINPDILLYINSKLVLSNYWLDSTAEERFFHEFLQNNLGSNIHRWVMPQVEITSLISSNSADSINGRIDFLICLPGHKPVIVEIDGEEHRLHTDKDLARDAALAKEGYDIFRIPSTELENLEGVQLSAFVKSINYDNKSFNEIALIRTAKFIYANKISHQIQVALIQAIQTGHLALSDISNWNLDTDLEEIGLFNEIESAIIFHNAISNLVDLLRNLGKLYSIPICEGELPNDIEGNNLLIISFAGKALPPQHTFFIQDISLPFHIANSVFTTTPGIIDNPSPEILNYFLKYIFRKPSFREGQVDAISRTLQGKDSIVLLPTGAGKSLAYQLASMLLPGRAVVIDPIVALMEDQIDNLESIGIDRAVAITAQISDPRDRTRVLSLFGQGEYLFAYISPERFQTVEFREALLSLTTHTPISLIAVDEAHCISEWGHDFRTAYLNIGRTSRIYCETKPIIPPLLALTGTASRSVLKDVQRELSIEDFDAIITPNSFDRPELIFHAIQSTSEEKRARLLGYLGQTLPSIYSISPATFFQPYGMQTFSGLIFCPHVNGDYGVVEIEANIKTSLSIATGFYSGKEPKFYSKGGWGFTKKAVARQFKHNQIPLLVCTKAFGMGIDKPNIRYTIHFGIPASIESFYQEAGRAGRDRKPAHCCILVSNDDPVRTQYLLDPNTKSEQIHQELQALPRNEGDDVTRALFFQSNAFPGIAEETAIAAQILKSFKGIQNGGIRIVVFPNLERIQVEKCLHRLLILGIATDYTINYGSNEFTVKLASITKESVINSYATYVAGYLGGRRQAEFEKANKLLSLQFDIFVINMVTLLLNFVYEVIEKGRRRALYEMLLAATVSTSDSSIRQRVLRYLEATQSSELIEQILAKNNAGLYETQESFETIRSPNEAAELRGQVARYLESYPDHPGLLMLRALSEISCKDNNAEIVKQNFLASISSAKDNYNAIDQPLNDFVVWAVSKIAERDISLALLLQVKLFDKDPNRILARCFIAKSHVELVSVPAWFLIGRLANLAIEVISK